MFGSFTEDEIRSMKFEQQKNDLEITFGSVDSETLRSVGIFTTKVTDFHSLNTCELLDTASSQNVNRLSSNLERTSVAFLENGYSSSTCPCDIVKELKPGCIEQSASVSFSYTHILSDKTSLGLPDVCSRVNGLSSSLESVILEGTANGVHQGDSNGSNSIPWNFLPRGLVNFGNLCFLNATLQALLSCAPFFELLHELRNRDIPEVACSINNIKR